MYKQHSLLKKLILSKPKDIKTILKLSFASLNNTTYIEYSKPTCIVIFTVVTKSQTVIFDNA